MSVTEITCIWCAHVRGQHAETGKCLEDECRCVGYTESREVYRWECSATMGGGVLCGATCINTSVPGECPRGHRAEWRRIDSLVAIAQPRTTTRERLTALTLSEARASTGNAIAPHDASPPSPQVTTASRTPTRERLPSERPGRTRVFRLKYIHKDGTPDVMQLYFSTGEYADGRLGEVFVKADRTGSMARGALDVVSIFVSMMLQYGVPLETIIEKLRGTRFQPDSFTGDPQFPSCTSPLDLLGQWLWSIYGNKERTT